MKKSFIKLMLALVLAFAFVGCATTGTTTKDVTVNGYKLINGKPEWVYNPGMGGKTGGVGLAKIHVSGDEAQRNLALTRAIDMLARQKGVTVNNVLVVDSKVSDNSKNTKMQSTSLHSVDQVKVNAEIKEWWQDPIDGEIAVWVIEK